MSSQLIKSQKENAEIYHGEDLCKQKLRELLEYFCLPPGILPLDIMELGYNQSSGFIWLKQRKKKVHKFHLINRTASFDTEVTAFIEKGKMRNITGFKGKQLLLSFSLSTICIRDPSSGMIEFAISDAVSMPFPVSAFELKDDKGDSQNNSN